MFLSRTIKTPHLKDDLIKTVIGFALAFWVVSTIPVMWKGLFFIALGFGITSYLRDFQHYYIERPAWVWVIFFYYSYLILSSIHGDYTAYTEGKPFFNNEGDILGFNISILRLIASIMLVFRIAFNRWLWISSLVISVFFDVYLSLTDDMPFNFTGLAIGTVAWFIFFVAHVLTAIYSFKLEGTGYYTHSQLSGNSTMPWSNNITTERPFWMTLLIISQLLFVVPIPFAGMHLHVKTDTPLVPSMILVTYSSCIVLSFIGIWRLKMWGVAVGILGILVLAIPIRLRDSSLDLLGLYVPIMSLYVLAFLWLKKNKPVNSNDEITIEKDSKQ